MEGSNDFVRPSVYVDGMPRGGASMVAGGVYHVIPRFVAKQWFVASGHERRVYLSLLGKAIARTSWRCFSYAVMSNHVHLALLAGIEPLKFWLRPMHTEFARWINMRHTRIGAVIVRGPTVVEYQSSAASCLISYIHGNPVRGHVVSKPTDCDWTSHRVYAGLSSRPEWLDVKLGVRLAGFDSAATLADWVEASRVDRARIDALRKVAPLAVGRPRGRLAS